MHADYQRRGNNFISGVDWNTQILHDPIDQSMKRGNHVSNQPRLNSYKRASNKYILPPGENIVARDKILTIIDLRRLGCSFRSITGVLVGWGTKSPDGRKWTPRIVKNIYDFYEQRSLKSIRTLMLNMAHPRGDCWQRNLKVDAFEIICYKVLKRLSEQRNIDEFLANARCLIMHINTYIEVAEESAGIVSFKNLMLEYVRG